MVSRLRECATVKTGCKGKAETHNRINPTEMEDQTERLAVTQGEQLGTIVRWVFPRPAQKTTFLDEWDSDLLGETILPTGEATQQHTMASGRLMDKRTLDGVVLDNFEGGIDDPGPTATALPASQKVAINYNRDGSTTNRGLTLGKLIVAKSKFGLNEVYGQYQKLAGDKLVMAVGQDQLDDLLFDVEQVGNADYNKVKALVDGEVDYFMGIYFKRVQFLTRTDVGGGVLADSCPMWVKSLVKFNIWRDFRSRISIRDDLSEAIQIRSKVMVGACRLQEEGVVIVDCHINGTP